MDPRDRRATLRIVDANLNRAAEALRVAEDVCRFHWNLPDFAKELKSIRHRLFAAISSAEISREELLRYRDIEGDVGRDAASPPTAGLRPGSMALRNIERAKEAIRTVEEASRLCRPEATGALEALRYELYGLEKALAFLPPHGGLRARVENARVYLLATSSLSPRPLADVVREAVEGGCDAVQLREKDLPDRDRLDLARTLRQITARGGALFILNDRPDLALLAHADGVHLGQEDLPVAAVRQIVGEELLIGVSTHSVAQARKAQREGADYIGVGPVFPTTTKDVASPPLGADGLREVLEAVCLPAFAIGGIRPERVGELALVGCRRLAVSSWLLSAKNVRLGVKALRQELERQLE